MLAKNKVGNVSGEWPSGGTGGVSSSAAAAEGSAPDASAAARATASGREPERREQGLSCQFIFGDPSGSWHFCGRPLFKKSFCSFHYRLCYAPPGSPQHEAALADIAEALHLLRCWREEPLGGAPLLASVGGG